MASVYNAHGAARTGASGGEAGMFFPSVGAAASRGGARVLIRRRRFGVGLEELAFRAAPRQRHSTICAQIVCACP